VKIKQVKHPNMPIVPNFLIRNWEKKVAAIIEMNLTAKAKPAAESTHVSNM